MVEQKDQIGRIDGPNRSDRCGRRCRGHAQPAGCDDRSGPGEARPPRHQPGTSLPLLPIRAFLPASRRDQQNSYGAYNVTHQKYLHTTRYVHKPRDFELSRFHAMADQAQESATPARCLPNFMIPGCVSMVQIGLDCSRLVRGVLDSSRRSCVWSTRRRSDPATETPARCLHNFITGLPRS